MRTVIRNKLYLGLNIIHRFFSPHVHYLKIALGKNSSCLHVGQLLCLEIWFHTKLICALAHYHYPSFPLCPCSWTAIHITWLWGWKYLWNKNNTTGWSTACQTPPTQKWSTCNSKLKPDVYTKFIIFLEKISFCSDFYSFVSWDAQFKI